ncbi:MAG: rhomboid family intramembrane serine protease [Rhizobiaceae bacterium]|nr:rhomboid family intramembrane serine protease [Rhizobiaceae bacterium]
MSQEENAEIPHEDEEPPRREPVFNIAPAVVAIAGACVAIHLVSAHLLSTSAYIWLIENFAFIPIRYSGAYPFTLAWIVSPVLYSLLHGGYAHLIINMIWLAAFGSPLANRIGTRRFLLFWTATALGAVALHYALHSGEAVPLVGASGAISGMMGAAARFAFRIDRKRDKPAFAGEVLAIPRVLSSRPAVTFLAVWFAINFATGLGFDASGMSAQIAWEAHIGGFLVGFFAIRLFDRPSLAYL